MLGRLSSRAQFAGLGLLLLSMAGAHAQTPNPPNPVSVEGGTSLPGQPSGAYFFDNFEYVVGRNDTGAQPIFISHGYSGLKSTPQSGDIRTGGYVFTQPDTALGSRVLVLESRPSDAPMPDWGYGQTDYYLQLGSPSRQAIPPNAWIQFWTYSTAASRFAPRDKTFYPCRGDYPCQSGQYGYLFMWGRAGCEYATSEADYGPAENRFMCLQAETADWTAATEYPWGKSDLFHNVSRANLLPARWYQVRLHIDMSGAQGTYEAWIRERGASAWTKVADWRGGVTPNFTWPIPAAQRTGFTYMRMPTTVNGQYGNSTTYMDDFTIARSEADLPR